VRLHDDVCLSSSLPGSRGAAPPRTWYDPHTPHARAPRADPTLLTWTHTPTAQRDDGDAAALYELASANDFGREAEAIPLYRRALTVLAGHLPQYARAVRTYAAALR